VKQRIFVFVAGVVILLIGILAMFSHRGSEWTSDSPEAVAELEAARDASQKLYMQEARKHLKRALTLDPDFVIAKLRLAEAETYENPEEAARLLAEVRKADLEKLKPREGFLVERTLMLRDGKRREAAEALDTFFRKYPDDPEILYVKAMDDWQHGRLEDAKKRFTRLLEIRPNWVIAYNQLGYISLIQGCFPKAEEYFTSYRFIAPDQANPHDSLGELYVLTGRWDEAEASFRKALEVKPGFAASMGHLAALEALRRNWEAAEGWIQKAEKIGAFRTDYARGMRCGLESQRLAYRGEWKAVLKLSSEGCDVRKNPMGQATALLHEAACRLGRPELAEKIEAEIEAAIEKKPVPDSAWADVRQAMLEYLRGTRQAILGSSEEAVTLLEEADAHLMYLNMELGLFKMHTRCRIAGVLFAEGRKVEAESWLEKVRRVNPVFVRIWEEEHADLMVSSKRSN